MDAMWYYIMWYRISASRRRRFRPLRSLTTKESGTEQTVQTIIRCKQAICKCQELHGPSRKTTRLPHAVRTYIPQVGYLFSSFDMLYVRKKEKAKHGTAAPQKQNEKQTEIPAKKPRPFSCKYFLPDRNTLHRSNKKHRTAELLSQPRTSPVPLATTSPPTRSG